MQDTHTNLTKFSIGLFLAVLTPIDASAGDESKQEVSIAVDNQSIEGLRRISYRVQKHYRAAHTRPHTSNWPSSGAASTSYRGKIAIRPNSDTLDDLMKNDETFTMIVSIPNGPNDGSGEKRRLRFLNCKITERDIQISRKGVVTATYFFNSEGLLRLESH